jgi:hypothetical protein
MSARRVNQLTSLQPIDGGVDRQRKSSRRHFGAMAASQSPSEVKKSKGRLRKIDLSEDPASKFSKTSFPLKIATRCGPKKLAPNSRCGVDFANMSRS